MDVGRHHLARDLRRWTAVDVGGRCAEGYGSKGWACLGEFKTCGGSAPTPPALALERRGKGGRPLILSVSRAPGGLPQNPLTAQRPTPPSPVQPRCGRCPAGGTWGRAKPARPTERISSVRGMWRQPLQWPTCGLKLRMVTIFSGPLVHFDRRGASGRITAVQPFVQPSPRTTANFGVRLWRLVGL